MTPSGIFTARGTRQTVLMTLALWGCCFVVFAVMSRVRDWTADWSWIFFVVTTVSGLAVSVLVYLVAWMADGLKLPARWTVLGLAASAGATLQAVIDHQAFVQMYEVFEDKPMPPVSYASGVGLNVMLYIWLFVMYVAALELMRSMATVRERERQLAQAREAAHQAQLAALRFQLNPHFLFNTLNAISSLVINRRNADAEAMMGGLCDFLRASLEADPDQPVFLEQELATIETYLEIERVRFGDRLAVRIECEDALLDARTPGFILQPLVENAVKYAVAPSRGKVTVSVGATREGDDLVLTVEDQQKGVRPVARGGTGVGLGNVRARLEGLYGARARLEAGPVEGGFRAAVRLPLLHQPILEDAA